MTCKRPSGVANDQEAPESAEGEHESSDMLPKWRAQGSFACRGQLMPSSMDRQAALPTLWLWAHPWLPWQSCAQCTKLCMLPRDLYVPDWNPQ
eukprot:1364867-Amphidinium_carterae.4